MKKFYLLLFSTLLFAAVAISNTGCKPETVIKIDTLNKVSSSGKDEMSCKIDGTLQTAGLVFGSTIVSGGSKTTQVMGNLGVLGATSEGISFTISGDLEVKDYPITGNDANAITYVPPGAPTAVSYTSINGGGKITITSISDDRISGTFSGEITAFDGSGAIKQITEGKFSCKPMVIAGP